MFKSLTRLAVAAALLASTAGCYSFGINAQRIEKPVSLSSTIGRSATVQRHFRHDMLVTWYIVQYFPFATLPSGPAPVMTSADKLVQAILKEELKDGDGITNLRVTNGYTIPAIAASVALGLLNYVPVVGTVINAAFRPMGVTIEGDVVRYSDRGAAVQGPVITARNGEIDMAGVDINAMLREQAEALAKAEQ